MATQSLYPELSLHYRSDWYEPNEPQCAERPEEFELLFFNLRIAGRFDEDGYPCDVRIETVDQK